MVKKYEKLTLSNEFVFGKVTENEELCQKLLETLLQTDIESLQQLMREKEIRFKWGTKPVRRDIYVKDKKDVLYDAEMQNKNGKTLEYLALPKRSRYYQSVMDSEILKKGVHYSRLNDSYIIFICTFDPFGLGQYVYTFRNICEENTSLQLGDKATKIFFNTKSKQENIPENIKNLFAYIETGKVSDDLTQKLEEEILQLRNDEKWWGEYMKSVTWEMDARYEGHQEGVLDTLIALVKDGIIDITEAAKRANISEDEFMTMIENCN